MNSFLNITLITHGKEMVEHTRPRKIDDLILKTAPPLLWRLSSLRGQNKWKYVKLWSDQTRMMF